MPTIRLILHVVVCCILGLSCSSLLAQNDDAQTRCAAHDELGSCLAIRASMINLIATPERFDGKTVQIIGHLVLEFENLALHMSRDSSSDESLWFTWNDPKYPEDDWTKESVNRWRAQYHLWRCKYNGQRVIVRGRFENRADGHLMASHPGRIVATQIWLATRRKEKACIKQEKAFNKAFSERANGSVPTL